MCCVIVLASHQNSGFAGGTSPLFAGTLATDKGIIEFNNAAQFVRIVLIAYCRAQLSQHPLGCQPGNTDEFGQPQRGDTPLVRRYPVKTPKLFHERQFGVVKQGASGHRSITMASRAFADMRCLG